MIEVDELHLKYSLLGFRDNSLKSYLFKLIKRELPKLEEFHALRGISFKVVAGERVGILGQNGAGKTTLLRAIAGLYPISSGKLRVEGKIRSLLELSLGFELEATGRENILYRGLLFGQSKKTMKSLEEEIIRFAELGPFIDYPVKTYSAGMLVRLSFAISTLITGDILLLDEVIGAGDAAFTKKASERMHHLVSQSKILLLASHDTQALRTFCNRLLVLKQGELVFDGEINAGIDYYFELISKGNYGRQ